MTKMQYVLKLTVLGTEQKVFRVVSIEGKADISHVLNLCNLSFDYGFYDLKHVYFPLNQAAYKALSLGYEADERDYYVPNRNDVFEYWKNQVDWSAETVLSLDQAIDLSFLEQELTAKHSELSSTNNAVFCKLTLGQNHWANLQRADLVLEKMYWVLNHKDAIVDQHPSEVDESLRQKFIYEVNGVQHLVEVMTLSEKLKCFLPATLMGEGLIKDEQQQLSVALIEQCLKDNAEDDSLNLKECTSRMRALGAMRGEEFINQAIVNTGTPELKFKQS